MATATAALGQPAHEFDGGALSVLAADVAMKRHDCEGAIQDVRALAEGGDARGQSALGILYFACPVDHPNYRLGAHWFKLAADQGDAYAQDTVGGEYDRGRGMPESATLAVKYYRLSAIQGNPNGQYSMCLMYYLGRGVQRDYIQAYTWCELAIANTKRGKMEPLFYGRDRVALRLSASEIADARRRAKAFTPVDLRRGKTLCANATCEVPGEGFLPD